ncbi:hypothetical protein FG05_35441 [Fusarium graminearum]|nr:hypothetical protein FG05_35441 [Fusarium graminearum]
MSRRQASTVIEPYCVEQISRQFLFAPSFPGSILADILGRSPQGGQMMGETRRGKPRDIYYVDASLINDRRIAEIRPATSTITTFTNNNGHELTPFETFNRMTDTVVI